MYKRWMIPGMLTASVLLVGLALAAPTATDIEWWVISGGGGSHTVGNISLSATIGQWSVGSGTSGSTQLGSGFWGGGGAEGPPQPIFLPLILRQVP